MFAISFGTPTLFMGCLSDIISFFLSLLKSLSDNGVSTKEGAITLTRTFGAYSAASARAKPSIAPFAAETLVWKGIPVPTATVLKKPYWNLRSSCS